MEVVVRDVVDVLGAHAGVRELVDDRLELVRDDALEALGNVLGEAREVRRRDRAPGTSVGLKSSVLSSPPWRNCTSRQRCVKRTNGAGERAAPKNAYLVGYGDTTTGSVRTATARGPAAKRSRTRSAATRTARRRGPDAPMAHAESKSTMGAAPCGTVCGMGASVAEGARRCNAAARPELRGSRGWNAALKQFLACSV